MKIGDFLMSKKIEDIEGIGPRHGDALRRAGISSVDKLLEAGCDREGRQSLAEKTGIGEKQILKCVNMADLFRIKGVASQYAELLECAGVDTVKELRNRNPESLAEKMAAVNVEKRLTRQTPSVKSVRSWVSQAKSLPPKVTY